MAMVCRGMAYLHRRVPRTAVSLWESQVPLREGRDRENVILGDKSEKQELETD